MIGVLADPEYEAVIREFFELFKTPWEFYQRDRQYKVLLCDRPGVHDQTAKVVFIFVSQHVQLDVSNKVDVPCHNGSRYLLRKDLRIPIYGKCTTFPGRENSILIDAESQEPAGYVENSCDRVLVRVGYDLFHEIQTLLTVGQPVSNAAIPTLDLHIALLRDLVSTNVPLVELLPVPRGYQFMACLTHDIDHPLLRKHRFDHTMFGFLYRAVIRSLLNVFRGRVSLRQMLTNWTAALKLPFVHLGLAKDFWQVFDRYPKLEGGLPSSFFVIPFKGDSGCGDESAAPKHRASAYEARDIEAQIRTLMCAGCEIGLHGIDAWRDSTKGRKELEEIRRITGVHNIGVRTHWLYADESSPLALERAGADYDSTVGYNETVGYRAGTTQAYKPLNTSKLLELPLHIMDTALFFPSNLNLSDAAATRIVDAIIDNAVRFGGVVTINWHDRSIAPERLWGEFYLRMIHKLKNKGAWFATASDAVSWFRMRRSVIVEGLDEESSALLVGDVFKLKAEIPELCVCVHGPQKQRQTEYLLNLNEPTECGTANGGSR